MAQNDNELMAKIHPFLAEPVIPFVHHLTEEKETNRQEDPE